MRRCLNVLIGLCIYSQRAWSGNAIDDVGFIILSFCGTLHTFASDL